MCIVSSERRRKGGGRIARYMPCHVSNAELGFCNNCGMINRVVFLIVMHCIIQVRYQDPRPVKAPKSTYRIVQTATESPET